MPAGGGQEADGFGGLLGLAGFGVPGAGPRCLYQVAGLQFEFAEAGASFLDESGEDDVAELSDPAEWQVEDLRVGPPVLR